MNRGSETKKHSSSRMQTLVIKSLVILIIFVFMAVSIELFGRFLFSDKIAFIKNIDHRMSSDEVGKNSDGILSDKEASDFPEEDLNIIFLGDSYTYGVGVESEASFPYLFELMLNQHPDTSNVNIANFGWESSSPYLSLRLLKDIGAKYKPDMIFLCLDMTDFHDDLKYQKLIERPTPVYRALEYCPGIVFSTNKILGGLSKYLGIGKPYVWIFGMPKDRFFIVNQPLEESRPYLENTLSNITALNEYSQNVLKSGFVLIILPRAFQYSTRECPDNWEASSYINLGEYVHEPFRLFEQMEKDVDYPIISLLDTFQSTAVFPTCFQDDPHWNESGHKVAAEGLFKALLRKGLF